MVYVHHTREEAGTMGVFRNMLSDHPAWLHGGPVLGRRRRRRWRKARRTARREREAAERRHQELLAAVKAGQVQVTPPRPWEGPDMGARPPVYSYPHLRQPESP